MLEVDRPRLKALRRGKLAIDCADDGSDRIMSGRAQLLPRTNRENASVATKVRIASSKVRLGGDCRRR